MNFDVDDVVSKLLPWDFSLKIGGQNYKTRPLRLVDVAQLQQLGKLPEDGTFAMLEALFEDPKPNAREWSPEQITAVAVAILKYFEVATRKNSQAVAARAATAMDSAAG